MAEKVNMRALCLDILLAVTRDGEFLNESLTAVLDKYMYLPKQERAFLSRLTQGTVERMIELDYIIDQFSKTKVNKMKPVIRNIIRMGVYQLKYMDSVPDSAACNEAVKLATSRGFAGLKGFVNGVLRNISRNLDNIKYPDANDAREYFSIKYSMPNWIVERYLKAYGREQTEEILKAYLVSDRAISIRVNLNKISVDDLKARLEAQGITVAENEVAPCGLFISDIDSLEMIPEFNEGLFYIQDTASMMVALKADPKPGDYIIDLCAAPGGKSLHAAELLNGTGHVEARDLTEYKVNLIQDNIDRLGLKNISTKVWDATKFDPDAQPADIVIADLPCSGLGVIGKKVDIKYNITEQSVEELSKLQRRILDIAVKYLKTHGRIVYSTCTITEEENAENILWFLDKYKDYNCVWSKQYLPTNINDGFFISIFEKK